MIKKTLEFLKTKEAQVAIHQDTVAPTEDNYEESLKKSSQNEEKLSIISFFLGVNEYAFEVTDAVEVLKARQLTEVPRTPEFIKGILSLRGEMIPVIDLKKRLGISLTADKASSRILVAAIEDVKAGFLVDKLSGVKEVSAGAVEVAEPQKFIKGVIKVYDSNILLLDTSKLIDFSDII
ncbi:MAG: chemotaxis protein CheW [Deltaproteobacteria bacterium]|nr:chemotaxis protein CheW [Deltaproteobacteria bacterium]